MILLEIIPDPIIINNAVNTLISSATETWMPVFFSRKPNKKLTKNAEKNIPIMNPGNALRNPSITFRISPVPVGLVIIKIIIPFNLVNFLQFLQTYKSLE